MPKFATISIQPFYASVSFYIGDFQSFSLWLEKHYGMSPDRDCSLASAATFDVYRMDSEHICSVWIPYDNERYFPVIAHEITHAVGLICLRRGLLYSTENTEVVAYLTEYLMAEYSRKMLKSA